MGICFSAEEQYQFSQQQNYQKKTISGFNSILILFFLGFGLIFSDFDDVLLEKYQFGFVNDQRKLLNLDEMGNFSIFLTTCGFWVNWDSGDVLLKNSSLGFLIIRKKLLNFDVIWRFFSIFLSDDDMFLWTILVLL